ncbi:C-X-C chemokine receptor type 3-like isoform X1 [Sceloporus undulatus]|uniref:C-X-C chemokine receptor type 3-like isoform X1 n=2 Tax=Sceloporus undulatus TaxID=8520 RepID=UPI001C4D05F4|nr:C-X-C chemokine receptor type 3-like isoform X1 [Sceloporus undulatus]
MAQGDFMIFAKEDIFYFLENTSDGFDYSSGSDACCATPPCDISPTQAFAGSVLPTFYSLICLLGLWGNGMVILVLLRAREALTGTEVFIFNLAISDILLVVTLPFWAVQEAHGWIFGNFLCQLVGGIFKINFYASIFFLVCISLDRYLSIVYVIRMYRRSKTYMIHLTAVVVWTTCILLTLPDFIYLMAEFDSRQNITSCSLSFPPGSAKRWKIALSVFNQVVAFFLPLVAMAYCYAHIIFTLLLSRGFQKHKTLRVILAVVAAFFFCWSPYHLVQCINTLIDLEVLEQDCVWEEKLDMANVVTTSLGFFHCCLNPLLYAFVGIKFRNRYLALLEKLGCVSHRFVTRHAKGSDHWKDSTRSESTDVTYSGGL